MKIAQHILRLLFALLVFVFASQSLNAAEKPIGLVVALRGQVIAVNSDGVQRRLAIQSKIYLADTIKTGRRGRVQLMFDDNTLISLGTNTDMVIADYQWNPDQKTGAMKTRVQEGVFRIMGGAITQAAPDNFKTETPAGTIGIRGSMYAGKVSGSSLRLLFQGGKGIYVSNGAGTVNIDRPGFGTFVADPSTPPAKPARLDSEALSQLNDVTAGMPAAEGRDDTAAPEAQSQAPADAGQDDGTAPETAAPVDADQGAGTSPEPDSQIPADPDGSPDSGEEVQPVQEAAAVEAFDEPATAETTLTGTSATTSSLQSTAISSPVDTVKSTVTDAVLDSIDTVRQEKVLEIEQAILDLLLELGFTGDRSLSVPANGIEGFDGVLRHKPIDSQEAYSQDPVKMVVNWHNHKFFGVVGDDTQPDKHFPVFIFGDVTDTALDNITAIGGGLTPEENRVATISGSGVFGQLYGTQTDATGFAMQGVDVDVQFQSNRLAWTAYGAALSKGEPLPGETTPGGTHTLKGFVMGIAEDMAGPDQNRRIFMNNQASEFQLTVNKDTGTISGDLWADDFNLSGSTIAGLHIGGALGSAYVLDDAMIALLGGADCITSGSSVGGLKPYGNYLVTEKQADLLAPYTTWGYWEIAYRDPKSGTDYHVHHPIAYWIAGPQTPAAEVNNLIATNFTGTYTGGAEGIKIESTGMISGLTGGFTELTIDFSPAATMPLAGNITFDQVNLNVFSNPGDVNASGFSGIVNGAISSKVKGSFFGPNAAAIGGNFGAEMSTGESYHGIFAGSRP
jgi:hypothetical protein